MKISVAMCTYNGSKFLSEQLESILNQTQKVNEIIICDDCSQDNTKEVIFHFQKKHPGLVTLYVNETNIKVNENFEKAIKSCNGDYIFLSDQDDIWKAEKVEKTLSVFNKNPKLEGVFSNGDLINELGEKITDSSLWDNVLFLENHINEQIDLFFYISNIRNMVTGATLCIKKEVKKFIFPFPKETIIFHDEWLALLLASRKTLSYSKERLISYRVHSSQQVGIMKSSSIKRNLEVIQNILNFKNTSRFKQLCNIRKSFFRNYYKFKKLKENYEGKINVNLDAIIQNNYLNIIKTENRMKKSNPLRNYFNKFVEILSGKRKL